MPDARKPLASRGCNRYLQGNDTYSPDRFGVTRETVEKTLEKLPGQQLALVRYSVQHQPADEWVYNSDDINASKVIWARDMDPASNRELLQYYKNRHAWLARPDEQPVSITPYPVTEQVTAANRHLNSPAHAGK